MGFVVFNIVMGVFLFVSGVIIKNYNLATLITFVDLRKYDNNKSAAIAGAHIMALGLISLCLSALEYFFYELIKILEIVWFLTYTLIPIAMYRRIYRYANKYED